MRCAGLIGLARDAGHEVLLIHPATGEISEPPRDVDVLALDLLAGSRKALAKLHSSAPLRAPYISSRSKRAARVRLQRFGAELSVVSELLAWSFASELLPSSPWIYDAHNVEHELFRSHLGEAKGLFERVTYSIDHRRVDALERRLLRDASVVLSVSERDAAGLRLINEKSAVFVVPNSVPTPRRAAIPISASSVVLFVGTLSYPPNRAAVMDLVMNVMPMVRRTCPNARLHIVGRRATPAIRSLAAREPFIQLTENASDVAPAYRAASCVLLPLQTGSGTNIKLFEALSHGVPVVATPKAVEGIDIVDGEGVRVRDKTDELAAATSSLLVDPDARATLGAAGRKVFLERLSWRRASSGPLQEAMARAISQRQPDADPALRSE